MWGFGQGRKSPEHLPKVNSPGPHQEDKETHETSLPQITDQRALTSATTEQDKSLKQEFLKPATTEQDKFLKQKPLEAAAAQQDKSVKQESIKPAKTEQSESGKQEVIKPATTEQSESGKQESKEKDKTALNQSVEKVDKPEKTQATEHKNKRENKIQFKNAANLSNRDRHIKTQELPRLPIIKEAVVGSPEIIAKKFNSWVYKLSSNVLVILKIKNFISLSHQRGMF